MRRTLMSLIGSVLLLPATASAGDADVHGVEITKIGERTYRFTVTVRHDDEGWDHYADGWVIEDLDGKRLAERVLHHPHVDEQPFTRSLSGVEIPEYINVVTVRARDNVHGFGGRASTINLPD